MAVDIEAAKSRLAERKRELEELRTVSSADRGTVSLDQQSVGRLSRMDALQRQAMAQAQERMRKAELTRIEAAFRDIADGEYGYCQTCGDEIAEKRLCIDPAARFCVHCAAQDET